MRMTTIIALNLLLLSNVASAMEKSNVNACSDEQAICSAWSATANEICGLPGEEEACAIATSEAILACLSALGCRVRVRFEQTD